MPGFLGNGGFLPAAQSTGGGAADGDTKRIGGVTFLISAAPASSTTAGNFVTGNTNYPNYVPPRNCVLTGITACVNSNPAGSSALIRIQVAGVADTTLTLTIPAGATREHFTTGTGASIAAGQAVRAIIVTDGSWTNTAMITTVFLEFTES